MASVQASEKLTAMLAQQSYDFDPNSTDPAAVSATWIDMSEAEAIMFNVFRSVGTGDIDTFAIHASAASNGANPVVVKAHALGAAVDAVGDQVVLECTSEELASLGTNLRYVMAIVELATGTDECVVTATRLMKHRKSGNTADIIS